MTEAEEERRRRLSVGGDFTRRKLGPFIYGCVNRKRHSSKSHSPRRCQASIPPRIRVMFGCTFGVLNRDVSYPLDHCDGSELVSILSSSMQSAYRSPAWMRIIYRANLERVA